MTPADLPHLPLWPSIAILAAAVVAMLVLVRMGDKIRRRE